jgi:hypothetical protein
MIEEQAVRTCGRADPTHPSNQHRTVEAVYFWTIVAWMCTRINI